MFDVVVVGGGIAGMQAAVHAHSKGASVALVSRTNPTRSYSITIQDGLNAALGPADSAEAHAKETVHAGGYLADQTVVDSVCKDAAWVVEEIDRWGAPFNRNGSAYALVQLPGSSTARGLIADDMTGHVLTQVLYEQVLKAGIKVYEEFVVEAVATEGSAVSGVVALDLSTGRFEVIEAKAVVLATGGPRRLYEPSTASLHCSGDGIAFAYRLGAPLVDMEFVQYHPFVLKQSRLAVTEVLTAGARRVTASGATITETGSALPRAIEAAIAAGQGVNGCVSLEYDFDKGLADRFFNTNHRVSGLAGLKLAGGKLPVRPAMHRLLGGVAVNHEGATNINGLFAVGECAGAAVHGAFGLPGNFLLASLTLARRTGRAAADYTGGRPHKPETDRLVDHAETRRLNIFRREGGASVAALRKELAAAMHQHAGLTRNAAGLSGAAQTVERITEDYKTAGVTSRNQDYNFGYLHHLELGYLLDAARAIVASAAARQESRGVHYRTDFPSPDAGHGGHHTLVTHSGGGPVAGQRPVEMSRWQPDAN